MKSTPQFVSALALAGAMLTANLHAAESGPYVRLENGINMVSGAKTVLGPISAALLGTGTSEKEKFKSAYTFGGAVGYRFNSAFATEVEVDHASNEFKESDGVDFKQTNLLANAVYVAHLSEMVKLTLGAGGGAQFTSHSGPEGNFAGVYGGVPYALSLKKQSDSTLVGQLKSGISIGLAENVSFDIGYKLRFVGSSDIYKVSLSAAGVSVSEKYKVDSRLNHGFTAGFTIAF